MSKFDRLWTMQLPVEKTRFVRAFRYVIPWEDRIKMAHSEFDGRIDNEKFYIKKITRAKYQIGFCDLNGTMQESENGLRLALEMRNRYKFNFVFMSIYAASIVFIIYLKTESNIILPLLFAMVLYVEVQLVHLYQNHAKREYIKLINDIATLEMSD